MSRYISGSIDRSIAYRSSVGASSDGSLARGRAGAGSGSESGIMDDNNYRARALGASAAGGVLLLIE